VSDRFFTAAYALDGELVGVGQQHISQLSKRWINVAAALLAEQGSNFDAHLRGPLAHMRLKLTSSDGMGLGMFFVNDQLVASTAYLRGDDPAGEKQLCEMFVQSLESTGYVRRAATTEMPFRSILQLRERPLHIAIVWGNPNVSQDDHQLVQEFATHMAAAFLCGT
jgi:hypothetical protein